MKSATLLIALTACFSATAQITSHKAISEPTRATTPQAPSQHRLPLSPLFARYAFILQQEIGSLRSESTRELDPLHADSDPYSIRRKAIQEELDRIEAFDLRTRGDKAVFAM